MTKIADHPDHGFSQSNRRAMRNPWVIGWLALVAIVLSVNAFMISMAFWTSPGLVVDDYYEQGKDYEQTINSRLAAQHALGWDLNLEFDKPVLNRPALFRITAADKVGQPLTGAVVAVRAYRPSDAAADFEASLQEGLPGQYAGTISFPLKGIWDVQMDIVRGEDRYEVTRRITVTAH
jgi:nitrogen fixation protein FixH